MKTQMVIEATWHIHIAGERDRYRDQVESIVLCRNVHTDSRQIPGPGPIVSYCAGPVPCTGSIPVP